MSRHSQRSSPSFILSFLSLHHPFLLKLFFHQSSYFNSQHYINLSCLSPSYPFSQYPAPSTLLHLSPTSTPLTILLSLRLQGFFPTGTHISQSSSSLQLKAAPVLVSKTTKLTVIHRQESKMAVFCVSSLSLSPGYLKDSWESNKSMRATVTIWIEEYTLT